VRLALAFLCRNEERFEIVIAAAPFVEAAVESLGLDDGLAAILT
jgi:hypothetical protein